MKLYGAIDLHSTNSVVTLIDEQDRVVYRKRLDNDLLEERIGMLERVVKEQVKLRPQFRYLKTVHGIGEILALTIMLEAGEISRFAGVGNFASYCR